MAGSPTFGRRGFLKVSALSAGALGIGSSLLFLGGDAHYDALTRKLGLTARPKVLSPKELAVVAVFFERLLPDAAGFPNVRALGLAERLDRELAFHTPRMKADIKAAILVVEHGGLAHLSPRRFTKLSPEAQDARITALATGHALERQVFGALKLLGHFFYYCDESTWPAVHYAGPLVATRSRPAADSAQESES